MNQVLYDIFVCASGALIGLPIGIFMVNRYVERQRR